MLVSVYRFDPDQDETARMEDRELDVPEGRDLMVLDVLELLKTEDPSIAYRAPVARACAAPTAST